MEAELPPFTDEEYAAHAYIESGAKGQAAVSPAGAIGLRQILPSTFDDEKQLKPDGTYEDINNEADNDAVGKRYLNKQFHKYKDKDLALTAYNAGGGNVDAAIHAAKMKGEDPTYANIQKYLPTKEAKEYAGRFHKRLGQNSPTTNEKLSLAQEPEDNGDTSSDYFKSVMLPIVSTPDFEKAPFGDKLEALGTVLQNRKWDPDTYDVASKLADKLWDGTPDDDRPKIKDIVGAPPMTGDKPEQELAAWKENATQKLLRDGVPLAVFGSKLDAYFNTATENELVAANIRNRSIIGSVGSFAAGATRDIAKGAVSNISGPLAGAAELSGYSEQADYLRKLPEYLGEPARDFEYNTNPDGSIATNPDGSPQKKWQGDIARGLGQLGGLLAGGAYIRGAGILSEGALATGIFGTQAIQNGGDVYKEVVAATGSRAQGYSAALMSMGPTALMSAGQMAVISRWAGPEISALSQFNRAKYMANTMARTAAVEAAAQSAGDAGLQKVGSAFTGKEFDPERTEKAAVIGALGGGLVSGMHAYGAEPRPDPQAPQAPTAPPPAKPPLLGLPAPDAPPSQHFLPPGTNPEQKLLPDSRVIIDPENKLLGRPDEYGTPGYQQVSDEERQFIASKLESFQDSNSNSLTLTKEQAQAVSPDLLRALEMQMVVGGHTITVNKFESYIQRDSEDLGQVNTHIGDLEKDLSQSITKEGMPGSVEEFKQLKKELKLRKEELGIVGAKENERMTTLVRNRAKLQKAYDDASAAHYAASSKDEHEVTSLDLQEAQAALTSYDKVNGEGRTAFKRIGRIQDRIDTIQGKLTEAQQSGYINNLKAKDRNLANLYAKRKILEDRIKTMEGANEETAAPFKPTLKIGNKEIIPHNGKWYIKDENGSIISKHNYYTDAVNSVNDTPHENTFVVKHPDRTAERPGDAQAVRDSIAREAAQEKELKAIRFAQEKVSNDIYEREYNQKVAKERKEAQKRASAERKERKTKKSSRGKEAAPLEGEGLRDGTSPIDESGASTLGQTLRGDATESQGIAPSNAESKEAEALKPSARSKSRIWKLEPHRPLTSDYTEETKFARDGPMVRARDIKNAINGAFKRFGKRARVVEGARLPKGVLGQYNSLRGTIETAGHNDVLATLHEWGHALDRMFITRWISGVPDLSTLPKEVVDAAKQMADTFYPTPLHDDITRIKEGLALWYNNYASGQRTSKTISNWYQNEFADRNPTAFSALEDIKDLGHEYMNQSDEAYIDSKIVDKPTKLQKLKEIFTLNNFRKGFIDRASIIADIDAVSGTNLKDQYDYDFRRGAALAQHSVTKGLIDLDGNRLHGMSYKEAISPAKGQLQELRRFMVAQRALAEFKKGRDPGVGYEEAQNVVQKTLKDNPNVVLAAHNLYKFWDNTMEVISHASPEMARAVERIRAGNLKATGETHGYYTTLQREGKSAASPLKSTVGSTRNIVDPFQTAEAVVQDLFTQALHSKFKHSLVTAATDPGAYTSIGKYLQDVTGSQKSEALKLFADKVRERTQNPELTNQEALQNASMFDFIQAPHSENQQLMHYFDGTNDKVLAVHPDVLKLFKDELPDYVNSPWFKVARGFGQVMRVGATTLRPVFQLKQIIRDPITGYRWVNSGKGSAVDAISLGKNILYSLMDDVMHHTHLKQDGWTALVERLGVVGAGRAGEGEALIRQLRQQYGDNILNMGDATLNKMEHLLSTPERSVRQAAVRMEAYRLGIHDPNQKLTPEQALSLGLAYKRSTTNFQIQGEQARVYNMIKPFFTARIAELSRLPGDVKRNPARTFGVFGAMLGYGIIHAFQHKDKQWYQEMDPNDKTSHAWFETEVNGVKKVVAIPLETMGSLAFGLGQLIGSKIGEDPNAPIAYSELVRAYLQPHLPLDVPLNPTWESAGQSLVSMGGPIVTEVAQQLANKDFYFNKQIVPPSYDFKSRAEQYNQYTSELAKSVANYVPGVSPMRLDHFMHATLPVSTDILSAVDQATGAKAPKEYAGMDFALRALARAGTSDGVMDRSQRLFTEHLLAFREGEATESPKDTETRKKLEKINKAVSDINVVINGTPDFDEKAKIQGAKRKFLQQGIRISQGSDEPILSSGLAGQAKQLKTQQKKQKQLELRGSAP
jgi:hypothetical protein